MINDEENKNNYHPTLEVHRSEDIGIDRRVPRTAPARAVAHILLRSIGGAHTLHRVMIEGYSAPCTSPSAMRKQSKAEKLERAAKGVAAEMRPDKKIEQPMMGLAPNFAAKCPPGSCEKIYPMKNDERIRPLSLLL